MTAVRFEVEARNLPEMIRLSGFSTYRGRPLLVAWRPLGLSSNVPSQGGQAFEVVEARQRWLHLHYFKLVDNCCGYAIAKPAAHVRQSFP